MKIKLEDVGLIPLRNFGMIDYENQIFRSAQPHRKTF